MAFESFSPGKLLELGVLPLAMGPESGVAFY